MRDTLAGIRSYQEKLAESIESTRLHLDAVRRQIQGTPAVQQIDEAEAEKERQDAIRKTGAIEAKPIFDALSALREAALSSAFSTDAFLNVANFARKQLNPESIGVYDATWPKAPRHIAGIIEGLPQLDAARLHVEG